MEVLISITSFSLYFCLVVFIIGIYKPWVALWWMEKQNRILVIKYYGSGIVIFAALNYILKMAL